MDTELQTSNATSDTPVEASSPGSTSPSGWALVLASVAIALAVLTILGVGFGIGYLLDLRNGVDPLGEVPNSTQCTTNT